MWSDARNSPLSSGVARRSFRTVLRARLFTAFLIARRDRALTLIFATLSTHPVAHSRRIHWQAVKVAVAVQGTKAERQNGTGAAALGARSVGSTFLRSATSAFYPCR